ncbi:MAG: PQQ-dependent sugar dehydrogenase [Saprospiraceae bacterium]
MKQFFLLFAMTFMACEASLIPLEAQNLQLDSTLLTATDIATGLNVPWEVKWGPDDHLWVTERRGRILRINPENGNTVTVLNYELLVESGGEPGMLGMALHRFSTNAYCLCGLLLQYRAFHSRASFLFPLERITIGYGNYPI